VEVGRALLGIRLLPPLETDATDGIPCYISLSALSLASIATPRKTSLASTQALPFQEYLTLVFPFLCFFFQFNPL
jgi:hypothetical protein